MKSRTGLFNENRLAETQMRQVVPYFAPFEIEDSGEQKGQKRNRVRTGHRPDGQGCQAASHVLEKGGEVIAPRERQTDRQPARQRRAVVVLL